MQNRIFAALALGASLVGMGGAAAATKSGSFNGTWNVQLVTDAGSCDRSLSYAIAVEDGRVRPVRAGDSSATVSGQIGADGNVNLDIRRGIAKADAFGRLQANSGSGTWQVALVGCSGRWTAQRRTTAADRGQ